MTRPSLPPNEARDWNRILTRLENVENKLRVLASQDTPTKFGDLDDVDTIFGADQSVATYDAPTGKMVLKPGGAGSGFPLGPETVAVSLPAGNPAIFEVGDKGLNPSFPSVGTLFASAKLASDPTKFALFYAQPPDPSFLGGAEIGMHYEDGTNIAHLFLNGGLDWVTDLVDPAPFSVVRVQGQGAAWVDGGGKNNASATLNASTGSVFDGAVNAGWQNQLNVWAHGNGDDSQADPAQSGVTLLSPLRLFVAPDNGAGVQMVKTPGFETSGEYQGGSLAIYAFDNAGSTELRVKFRNGTVATLATD